MIRVEVLRGYCTKDQLRCVVAEAALVTTAARILAVQCSPSDPDSCLSAAISKAREITKETSIFKK